MEAFDYKGICLKKELAKEIRKQLGINAQPLPKYGQASIEKYN